MENPVGFPNGDLEDVARISNPPYYTACPNPFMEKFLACRGTSYDSETDGYHREPFAADVSEGKYDRLYQAHTYHTKVPHKAIMRYIMHYTDPGDTVLDGFAGTGMTGVAAELCGDESTVESLGYTVKNNGEVIDAEDEEVGRLGHRHAILNDLSPSASFIASNYNTPCDYELFRHEAIALLDRFEEEYGWMYTTNHPETGEPQRIEYTVWSNVFRCPHCQEEMVFWHVALDDGKMKRDISCPNCSAKVSKRSLERATTKTVDRALGKPVDKTRQVPVLISYLYNGDRLTKSPDSEDIALLKRIRKQDIPEWYPTKRIDCDLDLWYERDYRTLGIFSVDAFFWQRSLIMTAWFRHEIESIRNKNYRLGSALWFWFESVLMSFSKLNRYRSDAFSQVNQILSGTLYVGAIQSEISPWYALEGKAERLSVLEQVSEANSIVSTGSTTYLNIPDSSVDYVFVDPPFGSNIIYSDLSIIWESWLQLFTNTHMEAVVHRRKKEGAFSLQDYSELMVESFEQIYQVLKPSRWVTVEFHNSRNSVWAAIQEALSRSGFVIADVRVLDKQTETFKQSAAAGAVKKDLVISAYKPDTTLEKGFALQEGEGNEDALWRFVRKHLEQLPVFVKDAGGQPEIVAERQDYLLYDRMVAFHVQRGVTVPLSASEFYRGLAERFPERDGMYFLPDQVTEYDKKRMKAEEVGQLQLFVTDEKSAIQWLRQELREKPQTYQEIQPKFLQQLHSKDKHEDMPELTTMLEENFLKYDGDGPVPSQIHSYLSSNYHDLRNLPKDSSQLQQKAQDRWYVPNPDKQADLEKLREQHLLKEFWTYLPPGYEPQKQETAQKSLFNGQEKKTGGRVKKLKTFRTEAVRAGFSYCWKVGDYRTILKVADRLKRKVLQEDKTLLMYYDNASMRVDNH